MGKLKHLDGLRGIASFVVVIHHFVCGFLPALQFPGMQKQYTRFDWVVSQTPINLLYSGNFAVCVFFVLSGYVLSYKFIKTNDGGSLISLAVKRYLRLGVPIFFSVFVAYLFMLLHLYRNVETARLTSSEWLMAFWTFKPSFVDMLWSGSYDVLIKADAHYNVNLWTMHNELYGSFLVFGFLALFGAIRNRFIMYILVSIVFFNSYLLGFVLGMFLCDITHNEKLKQFLNKIMNKITVFVMLALGLFLGSLPPIPAKMYKFVYDFFKLHLKGFDYNIICHTIGAALVLIAVLYSKKLQMLLSTKLMSFLGNVSFSLYIIHLVVICSFSCYLFKVLLDQQFAYKMAFFTTFLCTVVLLMGVSYAIYKTVDLNTIRLTNFIYNKFFKGESTLRMGGDKVKKRAHGVSSNFQ